MEGYKEYMRTRMTKFVNSMKSPAEAMWMWEELSLTAYTKGLWDCMSEEQKEKYNRKAMKRIIEEAEEEDEEDN